MAIFLGESFDCCFAINHCCDDLALFGVLLGADHDVIAIADCNIDHGIAHYFQEEELTLADQGLGEWEDLFDILFGKDRSTGGDAAYERDVDGLFGLDGVSIVGVGYFEGAALGRVLADKAFIDQGLDLIFD